MKASELIAQLQAQSGWEDLELPPTEQSFERACGFAEKVGEKFQSLTGSEFLPKISPLEGGSVDIFWNHENFQLLVNLEGIDPASYYGDNFSHASSIKGSCSLWENPDWMAGWMAAQIPTRIVL